MHAAPPPPHHPTTTSNWLSGDTPSFTSIFLSVHCYTRNLEYGDVSLEASAEIDDNTLKEPIDYFLPLRYPKSDTGELRCVYWDEETNKWSDDDCLLFDIRAVIDKFEFLKSWYIV